MSILGSIDALYADSSVRAALRACDSIEALVQTAITIQQIPAPTFGEQQRAEYVAACMRAIGLADVHVDSVGNVYGRHGDITKEQILLSAHTDTVFPADTDLTVRRDGDTIYGPGIGDNSLGVAALLHLAMLFQQCQVAHDRTIWFVANVCEEGLGDLRGMRAAVEHLAPLAAVLVIEGCDVGRIFHEAIGVRRYRISAHGPGGHSWGDFGTPSAIHALVHLATDLTSLDVPVQPRTTFNIGVIEGGTSVNSIAQHASLLLDLRSLDPSELESLIRNVEVLVDAARAAHPGIVFQVEQVGNRPAGRIARDHPLVQLATATLQKVGIPVQYDIGSTDANIPLSCGIPAVCVAVGDGQYAHRQDEYITTQRIGRGIQALFLLSLAVARVHTLEVL